MVISFHFHGLTFIAFHVPAFPFLASFSSPYFPGFTFLASFSAIYFLDYLNQLHFDRLLSSRHFPSSSALASLCLTSPSLLSLPHVTSLVLLISLHAFLAPPLFTSLSLLTCLGLPLHVYRCLPSKQHMFTRRRKARKMKSKSTRTARKEGGGGGEAEGV